MTIRDHGSTPLRKATWEHFSNLVAVGVAGGAAWAQATGKAESDAACRVQSRGPEFRPTGRTHRTQTPELNS